MFLPFRNAEIMSAVSFSLSQKCAGSSYPYIRNGFFILPVIQVVNIITQIALRKLCNKITVFLSYHQTFRSRIEKLLLSRNVYLGFCKSLLPQIMSVEKRTQPCLFYDNILITLHGLPAAMQSAGMLFVTTLPAPIMLREPIVTPFSMML